MPREERRWAVPSQRTRNAPACGSFSMNFSDAAKSLCGARHRPPDAAISAGTIPTARAAAAMSDAVAPSEPVAAEVDLEGRDAQPAGESEADRGRREQGVGRGQTDTSIHPRHAAHVSANGTAAIVQRLRCPTERHPRPMTSASATDDEEGPAERGRAERAGLEAQDLSQRERPGPGGGDAREARPVRAGRATPRAHGRLSTNATATPPTATPSARNDPRTPPARMLASTMQSATPSTSATTKA